MTIGFFCLTIVAVLLITVSMSQFVAVGIASGRAASDLRRRRTAEVRGLRQAAQIARLNSELRTTPSGAGVAWRVMEVAKIIDESLDCRSFYLVDPYGQTLPEFCPGQHVLVRPALAGAFQTTRCYSLSSAPDSRYWRITVKRQTAENLPAAETRGSRRKWRGPQAVDTHQLGLSEWLFQTVGVGDCLLIGGPNGGFILPAENRRPLVLLAAGIGITPLASMLQWSIDMTPDRPVRLLYQARDIQHWPLGLSLHKCVQHAPNCAVTTYFSQSSHSELTQWLDQAVPGNNSFLADTDSLRGGKFSASDATAALPGEDCDYFMCGPQAWMESLRAGLLQAGVAEGRIHREVFGTVPPSPVSLPRDSAAAFAVRFEASGVSAQWTSSDQSLWELAREHHVDIPSGCLSGVCGGCRVKLLAGQVVYDRQPALELASDECLACIARPLTTCRLDA